ncbi:MAG TPA: PhzF family phenazine biosynthesis protein [Vicinamibacterales bacterium]|nr:PhzF family phenazine biosynthesis protein [Vicinamibacterales bacterium]
MIYDRALMRVRFLTCDVFTDRRFGGNQLAVIPDASGLNDGQMQQIAREFNFSESTFVLPSTTGCTRRVRIFTPAAEIPFAGHPNVGTAFVLATIGELGDITASATVTFEEKAGTVPVVIERQGNGFRCVLSAPKPLSIGGALDPAAVAAALSISPADIVTTTHPPQVASVGLPFVFAEVRDRGVLQKARLNMNGFDTLKAQGVHPDILFYARSHDDFDVRARMFAPFDGVMEDPATGSANCALGAMLAGYDAKHDGTLTYRIAQGVEMGRPSVLFAEADKKAGNVVAARIGGNSMLVSEGELMV